MQEVVVDGVRLAWRSEGPVSAPAVLMLNALATDMGMWDPQAAALSARHRVIRMDWRGHGGSGAASAGLDFATAAEDALAVLRAAGVARAHLVGLSMGGVVAMHLALRDPGAVASLVLCATQGEVDARFRASCDARIAAVRREGMEGLVEPTLARWFDPGFAAASPDTVAAIGGMIRRTRAEAYAGYTDDLRHHAMLDAIAAIRAPTLVIAGERDQTTPPAALEAIARRIPGARLFVMAGSAHFPNLDAPAAFNDALARFLPG